MTIKTCWEEFERRVIPETAQQNQRDMMKLAFYSGVITMMMINQRLGESDISEEKGLEILNAILDECDQYKRDFT